MYTNPYPAILPAPPPLYPTETCITDRCTPFTGALVEGSLAARPLGQVARQINGANELWLAMALTAEPLQQLAPPQLAAVLSSLVAPDVRLNFQPLSSPGISGVLHCEHGVVAAIELLSSGRCGQHALRSRIAVFPLKDGVSVAYSFLFRNMEYLHHLRRPLFGCNLHVQFFTPGFPVSS